MNWGMTMDIQPFTDIMAMVVLMFTFGLTNLRDGCRIS
jgi:hypothetical protein